VEGFSDIDPQCPLGGPDGRKDILCTRGGEDWLAAVYFPPTRSNFNDVKEKFCHDFEGVARHNRDGFAFLTNQPMTPGEHADLAQHAEPVPAELYHRERIRSILDSPKGYGLRLEYLRIPMTEEEQHSLWSTLKDDITGRLTRQEAHILDLHRKMDMVLERTMELATNQVVGRSSLEPSPLHNSRSFQQQTCGWVTSFGFIACSATALNSLKPWPIQKRLCLDRKARLNSGHSSIHSASAREHQNTS